LEGKEAELQHPHIFLCAELGYGLRGGAGPIKELELLPSAVQLKRPNYSSALHYCRSMGGAKHSK